MERRTAAGNERVRVGIREATRTNDDEQFPQLRSDVKILRYAGCNWIRFVAVVAGLAGGLTRAGEDVWVKAATEHFTILTPAGPNVARKWAIELEQFRRGLQAAVPVPVERLRPVTVVLFKHDRAMQEFAPLENGRPVKIGGFFVRANDVNTIMLSVGRKDRETRHVIFHEAVHWHLSAREGFMPLWVGEGLAEVYATFEMPTARTYAFGAAFEDHVTQLQAESLLPLPKLVGIGRESLLYNEGMRDEHLLRAVLGPRPFPVLRRTVARSRGRATLPRSAARGALAR